MEERFLAYPYGRVSTEKQDTEGMQRDWAKELCKQKGFDIKYSPNGEFWFEKETGTSLKHRDVFKDMIADAKAEVDKAKKEGINLKVFIVVYAIDRAFRSVYDAIVSLKEIEDYGIGFISATQPYADTTNPMGKMFFYLNAIYAEMVAKDIQRKTADALAYKFKSGLNVNRPPYGYDKAKGKADNGFGALKPNTLKAEIVKAIFERYTKEPPDSIQQLCKDYSMSKLKVLIILSNPAYCGYRLRNGDITKDEEIPTIISTETFIKSANIIQKYSYARKRWRIDGFVEKFRAIIEQASRSDVSESEVSREA